MIELPPYGPIPDDVRDRVRQKVQKRIRKTRNRIPIGVAAGVALLAAGALVITRPDSPVGLATSTYEEIAMERCWAAIEKSGKTGLYPRLDEWRVAVAQTPKRAPLTIVGVVSNKAPFFCLTTDTSVTVSTPTTEPNYAKGSRTAALLMSPIGVVAGIVDPGWPAVRLYHPPHLPELAISQNGMFIDIAWPLEGTVLVERAEQNERFPEGARLPDVELPKPLGPAVSMVDRPAAAQERSSERGRALGECLARFKDPMTLQDPDSFGAGAQVERAGSRITMARNEYWVAMCTYEVRPSNGDSVASFRLGSRLSEINPDHPVELGSGSIFANGGPVQTLGGAVPMRTTRMELEFPNGSTVQADVANGTFAVIVPPEVPEVRRFTATVKLFDRFGTVFYSGPLRGFEVPK